MKKVVVLVALAMMVTTPVLAASFSIIGSKHDLSSQNSTGFQVNVSGNTNEICVYCHTPHGARINGPPNTLPLWNRSDVTFNSTDLYNSTSLDAASVPSTVSGAVAASDAPLCISCHDATNYQKALQNPPNSLTAAYSVTGTFADTAKLGTLVNDHPIGMNYETVQGNDTTGFYAIASVTASGAIPFFVDDKTMWCSSCHDVHNPGYDAQAAYSGTQFMNTTMFGSTLCLKCHDK